MNRKVDQARKVKDSEERKVETIIRVLKEKKSRDCKFRKENKEKR